MISILHSGVTVVSFLIKAIERVEDVWEGLPGEVLRFGFELPHLLVNESSVGRRGVLVKILYYSFCWGL